MCEIKYNYRCQLKTRLKTFKINNLSRNHRNRNGISLKACEVN